MKYLFVAFLISCNFYHKPKIQVINKPYVVHIYGPKRLPTCTFTLLSHFIADAPDTGYAEDKVREAAQRERANLFLITNRQISLHRTRMAGWFARCWVPFEIGSDYRERNRVPTYED